MDDNKHNESPAEILARQKALWNRRYKDGFHVWGDEESPTASVLFNLLAPASKLIEFGFGYGRDIMHALDHGHSVHGVEISKDGWDEADKQIDERQDKREATLIKGDFRTIAFQQGGFDAVYSHRMLHLLGKGGLSKAFAQRAAGALKPGGYLICSARDERDFDKETMIRHEDGTAEYKDPKRKGQLITFWNKAMFTETFSNQFEILDLKESEELEAVDNKGEKSFFTIMIARKKPVPTF